MAIDGTFLISEFDSVTIEEMGFRCIAECLS